VVAPVLSQMGASVVSFPFFGRVIYDGVRPPLEPQAATVCGFFLLLPFLL
jgi:hypothetical protein